MNSLFDHDEGDFDFSPSKSSNLSSLFGTLTSPTADSSSDSLKYNAPKQPHAKQENQRDSIKSSNEKIVERKEKTESSTVSLAKVITLWKIDENRQSTNIGKHIIAIIGSPSQNVFEVLIYKVKNNILIRLPLKANTTFYQYENNFVSFYDNHNQFWSVSFEYDNDMNEVLNEVQKHGGILVDKRRATETESLKTTEIKKTVESKRDDSLDLENGNSDGVINKTKADILSRITKMGQQILPPNSKLLANTSTELSESESEEIKHKKPVTIPRKVKKSPQKIVQKDIEPQTQTIPVAAQILPNNNNQMALTPQILANYPANNILYSQPFPDYGQTNFLLAQNLELKASLNEINSKLNNVLNSNNVQPQNSEEIRALKSKIKILNLKIDNLQTDLEKSQNVYEKLKQAFNEKCEKLNEIESKVHTDEEYKLKFEECSRKIEDLESKLSNMQIEIAQKDKHFEELMIQIEDLEERNSKLKIKNEALLEETENLNKKIAELEGTLAESSVESSVLDKTPPFNIVDFETNVKVHLNDTFVQIMRRFEGDGANEYSYLDIKRAVTEHLRKLGSKILEDIKMFEDGNS